MKGMRNIEVNGILWNYKVGKSYVLIENRDLKVKLTPTLFEVHRTLGDDPVPVTPALIKRYIELNA